MRSSDLKREENYNEFLRLLQNGDYSDVTYDEQSGGISAVHKLHKFDKQIGPFGIRRGDYEKKVTEVLRGRGHRIILESELSSGPKKCDGFLDDIPMDIKTVEGSGTWTICSKLRNAAKQKANCVVLFFPEEKLFSPFRVNEGIRLFSSSPDSEKLTELSRLLVIVGDDVTADFDKKAIPMEEWSV